MPQGLPSRPGRRPKGVAICRPRGGCEDQPDIGAWAYLADVFSRINNPVNRADELTPLRWRLGRDSVT